MRAHGLKDQMTGAEFKSFVDSYCGRKLDLRGVTVTVDNVLEIPAKDWEIRGGRFVRGAGMTTSEAMVYIGRADVGQSNTYLNTITAVTVGAASIGDSELVASQVDNGWYVAYGDLSTGPAPDRDSVTHSDGLTTHMVKAELVKVIGYSGGSILLSRPLVKSYGNLKLSPISPMRGVVLRDVEFDGYNSGAGGVSQCLGVGPTIGLSIIGCRFKGYITKGVNTCICHGVSFANCTVETDDGATARYGIEVGRCYGVSVSKTHCTSGRYGLSGQGTVLGRAKDCYFYRGADFDHGMMGRDLEFIRCSCDPSVAFWNCGNSAYFGGSEVTHRNCSFKYADQLVDSVPVYVYPNSTYKAYDCELDWVKTCTFPPASSGFSGDQGPNAITIGAGTVIERGYYGTHATDTAPGTSGGNLIEFMYSNSTGAAGSKLGSFTLEAGASLKCCSFAAPIRAEGLVGSCTFNISGEIWLQWVSASVPCILVNNGNHTINLNTGFVMGSTNASQPSATMDAVRVNAGVSGCTISRGANALLKWNNGASSTTLSPIGSDRVNDVSGLATIV